MSRQAASAASSPLGRDRLSDYNRRTAIALALGMGGAAVLAALGQPTTEGNPPTRLEELFPRSFGEWNTDDSLDLFVRPHERLGGKLYGIYDQILERNYLNDTGQRLMLLVAYGSEQSARLKMHRPEVCYPPAGFDVQRVHAAQLSLASHAIPVRRLHARSRSRSEPITYWTTLGDAVMADDAGFRLRQLSFGLRGRILDGMLVRVSSIDADADRAWRLHSRFAGQLALALDPASRARVIGRPE